MERLILTAKKKLSTNKNIFLKNNNKINILYSKRSHKNTISKKIIFYVLCDVVVIIAVIDVVMIVVIVVVTVINAIIDVVVAAVVDFLSLPS